MPVDFEGWQMFDGIVVVCGRDVLDGLFVCWKDRC